MNWTIVPAVEDEPWPDEPDPSPDAPFRFEFRLTGAGWAEARVSKGGEQAIAEASYLHDAPRELLEGIAAVVGGAQSKEVWWEGEPGGFIWRLDRMADEVKVSVRDDAGGAWVAFECNCFASDLAREAATAFRVIEQQVGASRYEQDWGYPFPFAAVAALEAC